MRDLVFYNNPTLRIKAQEITPEQLTDNQDELENIALDLLTVQKQFPSAVGLSAPQIGVSLRMFAIGETIMINPKLKSWSKSSTRATEGCLSLPEISISVPRYDEIQVDYIDIEFNPREAVLTDMEARVFQHELDHLDGKLIIDYTSSIQKLSLEPKLRKIDKLRKRLENWNKNKTQTTES